jgi:CubicO group peptidase (beta-lactamase class C family)
MPSSVLIDKDRLQNAARVVEEAVESGAYPCALLVVANSAETVWTHLVPGSDNVAADSIFPIASITKPIVATAVMRLVEEGRLLMNVPVATYLPEFAAVGKERVTTWHLLTHTSGLEENSWWTELYERWGKPEATELPPANILYDMACRSHLRFEPGTQCAYCSLSFSVLGELITRLGGLPYREYLEQAIFTPLGMTDTGFAPRDPARATLAYDQKERFDPTRRNTLAAPGGGLWSTAGDLIAFGQTFLRGGRWNGYRLLGPAAIEVMTGFHTTGLVEMIDGQARPFAYGLGWGKRHPNGVINSNPSYGHSGATGSQLWIDPVWDLVFVLLANRWGASDHVPRLAMNAVYGALDRA